MHRRLTVSMKVGSKFIALYAVRVLNVFCTIACVQESEDQCDDYVEISNKKETTEI